MSTKRKNAKKSARKTAKKKPGRPKGPLKNSEETAEKTLKALGIEPKAEPVVEHIDMDQDYEPYAPPKGVIPLAQGETEETAVKPGGWSSPDQPKKAPESAPEPAKPAEAVATPKEEPKPATSHSEVKKEELRVIVQKKADVIDANYIITTIRFLVEAVEYLAKRDKRLAPKDKNILKLRLERARKVQRHIAANEKEKAGE